MNLESVSLTTALLATTPPAIAFVQDGRSGEVLQALRTATCPGA